MNGANEKPGNHTPTIRVAAVGDIHVHESSAYSYRDLFDEISQKADVLVLCGDLTHLGLPAEAERLVSDLRGSRIPVVGVLGNHDYQSGKAEEVRRILRAGSLTILDEDETLEVKGVGFAGVKGFCGGFDRYMLASFGEEAVKHFVAEAVNESLKLEVSLTGLDTEKTVVVLHYAPVTGTLLGEPPELFSFLGSSRLAETIDHFNVTAVFHGHAHHGAFQAKTNKGVPVYNCCLPLLRKISPGQPYALVEI